MTVQVVCLIGGIVMALALAGLAVLVHLLPDDTDSGASGFMWAVGLVLAVVMFGLFTNAGLK